METQPHAQRVEAVLPSCFIQLLLVENFLRSHLASSEHNASLPERILFALGGKDKTKNPNRQAIRRKNVKAHVLQTKRSD